jgi:ABC-type phosphate transport system permease subunit
MTVEKIDKGLSALFHMFVLILFFIPTVVYGFLFFFKINRVRIKNIRQSAEPDWATSSHERKKVVLKE